MSRDEPTMTNAELEKLMPRCKTSDLDDFPDEHLDDSERCWNCRVWETIDNQVASVEIKARIDTLKIAYGHLSTGTKLDDTYFRFNIGKLEAELNQLTSEENDNE